MRVRDSIWHKYSYLWVTLILFVGSFAGQWMTHDGTTAEFWNAVLENWQSEFLQLMWQIGGMALFLYVGSPQSKEGSERLETKIDWMMESIGAIYSHCGYTNDAFIGNKACASMDEVYKRK